MPLYTVFIDLTNAFALEGGASHNNQVQLVPVLGLRVSTEDLMLRFGVEVGVGDTKVIEGTELK